MRNAANELQAAAWNGASGQAWVEEQTLLDGAFEPFEALLADEVEASGANSVLDVGCGSGATTLAVARRLGGDGRIVGIDVSEPLLSLARERAQREGLATDFVRADAQVHAFRPATFDMMISRFGVMFFDDPVAAFANLRRAATPDGNMRHIVFRSIAENPFMTVAERAAAPLLPNLPPRNPGAPGQFAFADRDRVRLILENSGWNRVEIAPIDVPCAFPATALERYFTRLGPLGQVLREANEPAREEIITRVRDGFQDFVDGTQVRFVAACWLLCARASG